MKFAVTNFYDLFSLHNIKSPFNKSNLNNLIKSIVGILLIKPLKNLCTSAISIQNSFFPLPNSTALAVLVTTHSASLSYLLNLLSFYLSTCGCIGFLIGTQFFSDPSVFSTSFLHSTPQVMVHVRRVYSLVGVAAGAAALGGIGSAVAGLGMGAAMVFSLGSIVPMLATIFMSREKVVMRQNLFLGAAAMMGIGLGPILAAAAMPTILLALGGTGAIMAGFSLAALKAPSSSYLKFRGLMLGAIFALLGAALLGLVGPALGVPASILAGLKSFSLYGGLAIFGAFIAFDTQQMIDRAAAGDTDHVSDALNLFIDIWGVFVRLLASTFIFIPFYITFNAFIAISHLSKAL